MDRRGFLTGVTASLAAAAASGAGVSAARPGHSPNSGLLDAPKGPPISRALLPFGAAEAYDCRYVFEGDLGTEIRTSFFRDTPLVYVRPPSGDGWPQIIRSLRVTLDGKPLAEEAAPGDAGLTVFRANATSTSGTYRIVVEFTGCNRLIRERATNPRPQRLTEAARRRYTRDLPFARGIETGDNRDALRRAGLVRRAGETTWRFVARVMQDGSRRWRLIYPGQTGVDFSWPTRPTDWLTGKRSGFNDQVQAYLAWVLRENGIPTRLSYGRLYSRFPGAPPYYGVDWFDDRLGAWVPVDLPGYVIRPDLGTARFLGHDFTMTNPNNAYTIRLIGSDDVPRAGSGFFDPKDDLVPFVAPVFERPGGAGSVWSIRARTEALVRRAVR